METRKVSQEARTAPVAWITLFGALIGVTALIPIFPYVGGGGYVPLLVPFAAIAPLLLGPSGGIAAAVVGGVIGMFLAPAGFPMGLLDVLLTGVLPAVYTASIAHLNKNRLLSYLLGVVSAAFAVLFPFYIPGASAGFQAPPEPLYQALSAIYWLPSLVVIFSPIGTRLIPSLVASEARPRKYAGIFIILLSALWLWFNPWAKPYWYIQHYVPAAGVATLIGYSWWVPALSAVVTAISVPVLEALSRSGLPKVRDGLW
ncbi:MAG: hypothetical protein IMW98_03545 [Firmicutes bacterium]|nr:hypothetical protein [Bacillota bacterium]